MLRIGTDGSSSEIAVGDWTVDQYSDGSIQRGGIPLPIDNVTMITNADQGVLLSLAGFSGRNFLITISGGAVTSNVKLPSQIQYMGELVLQAQDGTFVANNVEFDWDNYNVYLVDFDKLGNIKWTAPNYYAQIATADGGVVAGSYNANGFYSGQYFQLDANGKVTGKLASLPIQTWTGETEYRYGSTVQELSTQIPPATPPYSSFMGASQSANGTSPVCRDDRDQLTTEYVIYRADIVPSCFEFKNAVTYAFNPLSQNLTYSFSEMNKSDIKRNDHLNWALLQPSMLTGIQSLIDAYHSSPAVTSAYRSPLVNVSVSPDFPHDRHVHGDAVDLDSANDPAVWNALKAAALKANGACVEPLTVLKKYSKYPYAHVHADWRSQCPNKDWRQ
jgi:hypothetical protein